LLCLAGCRAPALPKHVAADCGPDVGKFPDDHAELVVVEWLFEWPGIGRLLALALAPARFSTAAGHTTFFLYPPLVAGLFAVLAGLFVIMDAASALASERLDPRTQSELELP
jgi:hypothetical protein